MIVCFNFFEKKKSSRPLFSSSPISVSWWVVRQLRVYKTFLYSKDKDAGIEDLKLEILICYKSSITEHWTLLHQTLYILPIP
jgi:hypothetical protein